LSESVHARAEEIWASEASDASVVESPSQMFDPKATEILLVVKILAKEMEEKRRFPHRQLKGRTKVTLSLSLRCLFSLALFQKEMEVRVE